MVFTKDDDLPTVEELTVPEIQLTSSVLRAGAHHFGKYCDEQSKEFMLCIIETRDPRICVEAGKDVTRCGFEFYGKVKKHCAAEFTDYWHCVDNAQQAMFLKGCRKTQHIFDECIKKNLGQERPPFGYFGKVRLHETKRPEYQVLPHKVPELLPGPPDFKTAPVPDMEEAEIRAGTFPIV